MWDSFVGDVLRWRSASATAALAGVWGGGAKERPTTGSWSASGDLSRSEVSKNRRKFFSVWVKDIQPSEGGENASADALAILLSAI